MLVLEIVLKNGTKNREHTCPHMNPYASLFRDDRAGWPGLLGPGPARLDRLGPSRGSHIAALGSYLAGPVSGVNTDIRLKILRARPLG